MLNATNEVIEKVSETITINSALGGRTVSVECSQFISTTKQFLAEVTKRNVATVFGLAGQILYSPVRLCQASQRGELDKLREDLEEARDTIENLVPSIDATDKIDEFEAELEAIDEINGKIDSIVGGITSRSSGIYSECSEFLRNVRQFYEAIRSAYAFLC